MAIKNVTSKNGAIISKSILKKVTSLPKSKIGSFAGITFAVSRKKILTFKDLKRDDSYNWTDHDVLNGLPLSEFNGAGLSNLSLQIELRSSFGLEPYATLEKLRKFAANGKTSSLIIGKKTISNAKFEIVSIGQAFEDITANGVIKKITVDLTLKQYNKSSAAKAKITKSKSKKTSSKKTRTKSKKKHVGTITIKASLLNARMSPSLKGKVKKALRKGQKYKVYSIKKTDITWYKLAGGLYCSAGSKYVSYKKA